MLLFVWLEAGPGAMRQPRVSRESRISIPMTLVLDLRMSLSFCFSPFPDLVRSCDLMWKQSVWTSVLAAQIASKFMNKCVTATQYSNCFHIIIHT